MTPVHAIASVLLAGMSYAVYRGFNPRKADKPGPHNGWRNQDFASRRKDGTYAEGSTMESDSSAPPRRGGGFGQ